jgi:hypothetical protein
MPELTRHTFELKLEEVAEELYMRRIPLIGGNNGDGHEIFFETLARPLRDKLECQQIILPKGECPDSGIFGNFNYMPKGRVNWNAVKSNELVVIEVNVPNEQKRYFEFSRTDLNLPERITPEMDIVLRLNELGTYEDFFGIEYKTSKNSSENRISVASFNSTCPSGTKTSEVKARLIHNIPTSMRKKFDNNPELKVCEIKLSIQFNMYYFVMNYEKVAAHSSVKHIFLCRGSFFAPTISEESASLISVELKPNDPRLNLNFELPRVKLRYRPFFESRKITASGFGLYTSWTPKIPEQIREARERELLLNEVLRVQQMFEVDDNDQVEIQTNNNPDNVIYLDLRAERIRLRSVG